MRQKHHAADTIGSESLGVGAGRSLSRYDDAVSAQRGRGAFRDENMQQENGQNRLELACIWADLVSKVLSGVALVVAAWWTYTNFTVERTHDPTMEVTVSPSVHPLGGGRALLNVDVFLQNVGKVAIKPKFPRTDDDRNLGLEISIVEIEPLRRDERPAEQPADDGGDPAVPWFDWTSGDGAPKLLLRKRNLLASNEDFRNGSYQLNPGVRYREPFACIVERDKLYAIRARFWTDDGSVADLVYVDTFRIADGGEHHGILSPDGAVSGPLARGVR